MRCPNCAKFTGLETEIGETNWDNSADDAGARLACAVTVNRNCADCGTTLKSAEFEMEEEWELPEGADPETVGLVEFDAEATESGGGRYAKNMIGCIAKVVIRWKNKAKPGKDGEPTKEEKINEDTITLHDELQASGFEEC